MKNTTLLLLLLSFYSLSFGQSKEEERYSKQIKKAWELYTKKEFRQSAEAYSKAFSDFGGQGSMSDRYNAACSWALSNEADSAFVQLFKIAVPKGYSNISHIKSDSDLNVLHTDKRWQEILELVQQNKDKKEANVDKELAAALSKIYEEDQKYRMQIDSVNQNFGHDSKEMETLWKVIDEKDSLNLIAVSKILDEKGWLGVDEVGETGNSTLFLVIQHADLETQLKYLPMMRKAAKEGKAELSSLALLEDRVALRQGKKQIYGSQIGWDSVSGKYYVLPLENPEKVDERRAQMNLPPLNDYTAYWDFTWNPKKHRKMHKKLAKSGKK